MGTLAHIVVVGAGQDALARARRRLVDLEHLWSRFSPSSEITRLNESAGRAVTVSAPTRALVRLGVAGWRSTGGRFDPTVLHALELVGYDRDFDEISAEGAPFVASPAPGCAGIEIDEGAGTVHLPAGVEFDPGGIAKGYAADLIAGELIEVGARGACVNVGGDLRVFGEAPDDDGWIVGVEHPFEGEAQRLRITEGAVATSTRVRRSWVRGGIRRHHLIDPTAGEPSTSGLASATVVTTLGWRAEVLAKAAFLSGVQSAPKVLTDAGATGFVVDDAGVVHHAPGIEAVLV